MVDPRVARGRKTQELAAAYLAVDFPGCQSRAASLAGVDIINSYGLAPEVKAKPGDVTGALRQAIKNAQGALPFVIWRPNGYGPERINEWPVVFRFEDARRILKEAGYGD